MSNKVGHPFQVYDGDVPDDVIPLKPTAEKAGYTNPVRAKSPIIEILKEKHQGGESVSDSLLVLWNPHTRAPTYGYVTSDEDALNFMNTTAATYDLELLAALDINTPFEQQISNDAHPHITSWHALGKYFEEETSSYLITLGTKLDPRKIAPILAPIQDRFDDAWENNKIGLLVYAQPYEDGLFFKPLRKGDDMKAVHIAMGSKAPDAQLIMALDTQKHLEDQIPTDLYENACSLLPFRLEPTDTLGLTRRLLTKDRGTRPPSPFRS